MFLASGLAAAGQSFCTDRVFSPAALRFLAAAAKPFTALRIGAFGADKNGGINCNQ